MYHSFASYPIDRLVEQCDDLCDQVYALYNRLAESQTEKAPVWFEANALLAPFTHLTLDENYDLYCYLSTEYHGYFGSFKAVRKGDDPAAKEGEGLPQIGLRKIVYPDHALNPIWVIYRDNSPEGVLETMLFGQFLSNIPLQGNSSSMAVTCDTLFSPPRNFEKWQMLVEVTDWAPKADLASRTFPKLYFFSLHRNGALWDEMQSVHLNRYQLTNPAFFVLGSGLREAYKDYPGWAGSSKQGRWPCLYRCESVEIGKCE